MPKTLTLAALALAATLLLACTPRPAGHREEAATTSGGEPHAPAPGVVDGETGAALARGGARVVDVRTPAEFAAGHVPGAVNVPFDEVRRRAAELGGPETPLVLYCRSGRRSAIAAEALRELGYSKVWDAQRLDRWPAATAAGARTATAPAPGQ